MKHRIPGKTHVFQIYMSLNKSGSRRRLALLINNMKFDHLKYRSGAEIDEQSMKILLENLGYTVVTLRNLTSQVQPVCDHFWTRPKGRHVRLVEARREMSRSFHSIYDIFVSNITH